MIDVMAVKLKVIQSACGITALSEIDLLHRLEELYLEGIVEGMRLAKETITHPKGAVMNSPAQAAECAEARDRNTPNVHGSGAEPQGMEAQATQPSAAPINYIGDQCPVCTSGRIGQSGYNYRCGNCGWLGPRIVQSPLEKYIGSLGADSITDRT